MIKTCGNYGNPCGRENCGFWEPNNEVLEQRYQQLAELAREMWHYVVAHNTPDVPGVDMSGFENRLEELGVEL